MTKPNKTELLTAAQRKMADGLPMTFDEVAAWTGKTKLVIYNWRTRPNKPLVTSPGRLILPKNLSAFLESNRN